MNEYSKGIEWQPKKKQAHAHTILWPLNKKIPFTYLSESHEHFGALRVITCGNAFK